MEDSNPSVESLFEQVRSGAPEALALMLHRLRGDVVRRCCHTRGDLEVWEDAVGAVVLYACKHYERLAFESPEHLYRWMILCSKRKVWDLTKTCHTCQLADSDEVLTFPTVVVENEIAVEQMLHDLSLVERTVVYLKVIERRTTKEVCTLLTEIPDAEVCSEFRSWPPETRNVNNIYERALKRLKSLGVKDQTEI